MCPDQTANNKYGTMDERLHYATAREVQDNMCNYLLDSFNPIEPDTRERTLNYRAKLEDETNIELIQS